MNTKTNADYVDGAQVLSNEELLEVHGGQEEIAILPIVGGWAAGKVLDRAWDAFSVWSSTVPHATYTDAHSREIDANNEAQRQQELAAQMDQMSGSSGSGGGVVNAEPYAGEFPSFPSDMGSPSYEPQIILEPVGDTYY